MHILYTYTVHRVQRTCLIGETLPRGGAIPPCLGIMQFPHDAFKVQWIFHKYARIMRSTIKLCIFNVMYCVIMCTNINNRYRNNIKNY